MTWVDWFRVLSALAPATSRALLGLARAVRDERPEDARQALELVLRMQFVARQNRVRR